MDDDQQGDGAVMIFLLCYEIEEGDELPVDVGQQCDGAVHHVGSG